MTNRKNYTDSGICTYCPDDILSMLRIFLKRSVVEGDKVLRKKGYIPLDSKTQQLYYKALSYISNTPNEVSDWLLQNNFCVLRIALHSPNLALFPVEK